MDLFPLTAEERRRLVEIFERRGKLFTVEHRRNFFWSVGLTEYETRLDLSIASPRDFCQSLVRELSFIEFPPRSRRSALVPAVEWLQQEQEVMGDAQDSTFLTELMRQNAAAHQPAPPPRRNAMTRRWPARRWRP